MCAMMPMFRQRSRGKVRATTQYLSEVGPSRARGLDEGLPEKEPTSSAERALLTSAPCRVKSPSSERRQRAPARLLPAVVREGLVGLGHLVCVLALFHRIAAVG